MYMFLNPEQEAMLPVPKTIEDAESQVHANIEAIMTWRSSAQQGSRNACITCGFYLGRIAALYREFPDLAKTTRKEVMGLNRVLNDIVDGVGVAPDTVLGKPVWIVNDAGEIGVLVHGRPYFLYKGEALQYSGTAGGGNATRYRRVQKRECGESLRVPLIPVDAADVYDYGAEEDGEGWHDIPAPDSVMHAITCMYSDGREYPIKTHAYCPHCGAHLHAQMDKEQYMKLLLQLVEK